MMQQALLVVVAAGSGGHIIPAVCYAQSWATSNPAGNVLFLHSSKKIDARVLEQHQMRSARTQCMGALELPQRWWRYPAFVVRLLLIFLKSIFLFMRVKPETVVSTGGIVSVPICFAAWALRIPFDLYELNAVPGRAVALLAPYARTIRIVFEECRAHVPHGAQDKCITVPYPMRYQDTDAHRARADAVAYINERYGVSFSETVYTILLLGGSQGSFSLNRLLKSWCAVHAHLPVQVLHQVGAAERFDFAAWYAQQQIAAVTFSYDAALVNYYRAADLAISRAGAGTLSELAFFNLPALILPLEAAATNHQKDNARAMAQRYPHLFTVLEGRDLQRDELLFHQALNALIVLPRSAVSAPSSVVAAAN